MLTTLRRLSTRNISISISPEITQALHDKVPVVALESTIITHGFPYPENLSMSKQVEAVIRENGGVPATCAFIKGVPYVGLSDHQLEYLAEQKAVNKVSRRDIGVTMAQKLNGGTTIAGTMIMAHMAGIKVFATGGLGGVHRDGHITMDVSADLTEMARTPVTVVCAGPKLILDIPRTMEFLETQGVFVGTYNDDGRPQVEVPGFFCRNSGTRSPYSFSSWKEIAAIVHNHNNVMQLSSGSLVCIPPPTDIAMSSEYITGVIENAIAEANANGVSGKELTPFLLHKIAKDTKGQSVECNKKFVINNAKAGAQIARELLSLEENDEKEVTFQPSSRIRTRNPQESAKQIKSEPAKQIASEPAIKPEKTAEPSFPDRVDTLVIGLVALDTVSRLSGPTVRQDSNPGRSRSSIGGVGYNVSLAYKYGLESQRKNGSCRLVSAVGDDFAGRSILDQLRSNNIDTSGVSVVEAVETAQYSAILDVNGDLELACADMAIIEDATFTNHVVGQINRAQPRFVVVDCNLLPRGLDAVVDACSKLSNPAKVVVEPTSAPKLARIANVNSARLRVFPNNHIELVTPTADELDQMFQSFSQRDLFDDYDHWFPVVDSLGINSQFRDRMEVLAAKNLDMKYLLENGILQQSFQLLPYIPNILVKLGARGCVLVKLSGSVTDYRSVPTTSQFLPAFTMFSEGREIDEGKKLGVVVQHFPVPPANENLDIVDVTGAGDSLLGYLAASLANVDWLGCEIDSLEQEWGKWENIHKSQLASGKSLASHGAVSPEIANI